MHCGNRFKAHRRNREYEWQKYCQRSCYTAARRGAEKRYGNPERSKQWHPGLTAEDALAVQDMNRSTSPPSMAEETSAMALMEIESRGSGQTAAEFLTTTGSDSLPVDASSAASKPRRGFVSYLDFVGPVGYGHYSGEAGKLARESNPVTGRPERYFGTALAESIIAACTGDAGTGGTGHSEGD